MEVYRIRRNDGLFSTGGQWPDFNKNGKIWKMKGHLTSHLNQIHTAKKDVYDHCELVVYEIVETEVSSQKLQDYIAEREEAKRAREEDDERRREKYSKRLRKHQYEELKKEFEPN